MNHSRLALVCTLFAAQPVGCHDSPQDVDAGDAAADARDAAPADAGQSTRGQLYGIASTDTGWVAVGVVGTLDVSTPAVPVVLLSDDGTRWERAEIPSEPGGLSDVAFGDGTIVAVGAGGIANSRLATRTPSGQWQVRYIGTNNQNVLFGNGAFLSTAGVEPGAMVSANGLDWTLASIAGTWFAFDGQRFIALSRGPIVPNPDRPGTVMDTPSIFRTSVDGVSWSDAGAEVTQYTSWVTSLAVVGDQILGFGLWDCQSGRLSCLVQLLGPAGTDPWNLEPTTLSWEAGLTLPTAIAADEVRAVVVSGSAVHATPLPVGSAAWTDTDVAERGWSLSDVSYRSGTFVAVGSTAMLPLIVTSSDGANWTEVTLPPL